MRLDPWIYWSPVRHANHYTKVSTVSERHRKAYIRLQSYLTGPYLTQNRKNTIKAFRKSCSIDSRNEQSPASEVVHEANKAHFRNPLANRFLPSSVGRALEWWSGGCGFKPHWGQFLMKFILFCVTLDLSEFLIVKNLIHAIRLVWLLKRRSGGL